MTTALLLVDLQNDFFPGGALAIANANEILPVINQLVDTPFDHVFATKDWHPSDHGSFAAVHGKRPGEQVLLAGLPQVLWPVHCVQGTLGAEFAPGWESDRVEQVFCKGVDKTIDSYSTFYDNGHLRQTGLADYLKRLGVKKVYLAGLATDYCVKYSALDALKLGFDTFVVIDGCRGVELSPGDCAAAMEEMQHAGAHLVMSTQVLRGGGI